MSERSQELMIRLGESLGQNIEQSGQRSFEQSALSFFKDKDVTPDTINQFSSMYPNVPLQNIYQYASGIGQIKERQEVNDIGMNLINADMGGAFKKEKDVVDFLQKQPGSPTSKQKGVQAYLQFKQTNANIFKKEMVEQGKYAKGHMENGVFVEDIKGVGEPVKISRMNPTTGMIETQEVSSTDVTNWLNKKDEKGNGLGWQQGEMKTGRTESETDVDKYIKALKKSMPGMTDAQEAKYRLLFKRQEQAPKDTEASDLAKEQRRKLLAERLFEQKYGAKPQLNSLTGELVMPPNPKTGTTMTQSEYAAAMQEINNQVDRRGKSPSTTSPASEMPEMPDPVKNKGRTVKDTVTGKRYKSNGTAWVGI